MKTALAIFQNKKDLLSGIQILERENKNESIQIFAEKHNLRILIRSELNKTNIICYVFDGKYYYPCCEHL